MCDGESVHERALCLALLGDNVGNHLLRHCIAHPAGCEECQALWYWHTSCCCLSSRLDCTQAELWLYSQFAGMATRAVHLDVVHMGGAVTTVVVPMHCNMHMPMQAGYRCRNCL